MFYFNDIPEEGPKIEGYLYGWRANRFDLDTFELTSPLRTNISWNGGELEAECIHINLLGSPWAAAFIWGITQDKEHTGPAPIAWCSCGFYSFDSLSNYIQEMDYKDSDKAIYVMTLIKMWGTIIQHDTGYRAQYVEADTIFLPEEHEQFEQLILQNIDVVIEPIEHAVDYDRSLPTIEDYIGEISGEHRKAEEED
ncbi:MAG: hypothetical protein ACWGQW_11090 [bacterium]